MSSKQADRQGGRVDVPTTEDLQWTRDWLEKGRQSAKRNPGPMWDIAIRAGEKFLQKQEEEYLRAQNKEK